MAKTIRSLPFFFAALLLFGCGGTTKEAAKAPKPQGAYRIYVTNEA